MIVLVVSSALSVVVAGLVGAHHVAVLFSYFLELHPGTADRGALAETGSRPLGKRRFALAADDVFGDVFELLGGLFVLRIIRHVTLGPKPAEAFFIRRFYDLSVGRPLRAKISCFCFAFFRFYGYLGFPERGFG